MLQFLHIGKMFGPAWVLTRFSLEVKPGEAAWLAGPPGSGKSLLLRMALGDVAPTTGTIHVNGLNPAKLGFGARQRLRRGMALVRDDEPALAVEVITWMALGPWCAGRSWGDSLEAARVALDRAGLADLGPRAFGELGRGEQCAVALARGLSRQPHVLLVDWAGGLPTGLPAGLLAEAGRYLADGGTAVLTGEPGPAGGPFGTRTVGLPAAGAGEAA